MLLVFADPLCKYKPDGNYPLRDTFTYLKCSDYKGTLVKCPDNEVFIAREKRCRTVTYQDKSMFEISQFKTKPNINS